MMFLPQNILFQWNGVKWKALAKNFLFFSSLFFFSDLMVLVILKTLKLKYINFLTYLEVNETFECR